MLCFGPFLLLNLVIVVFLYLSVLYLIHVVVLYLVCVVALGACLQAQPFVQPLSLDNYATKY